jgi:hypothetical protein
MLGMKMKIRLAIVKDQLGNWEAYGSGAETDEELIETLKQNSSYLSGDVEYKIIDAEVDAFNESDTSMYLFEAMDSTGKEIKDVVKASNIDEARDMVRQMGYFVTKITKKKTQFKQKPFKKKKKRSMLSWIFWDE